MPAVGKCLIWGSVNFSVAASALAGDATIRSRFYNVTAQAVNGSESVTNIVTTGSTCTITHKIAAYQNIAVSGVIRWAVWRGNGPTWNSPFVFPTNAAPGDATADTLGYIYP